MLATVAGVKQVVSMATKCHRQVSSTFTTTPIHTIDSKIHPHTKEPSNKLPVVSNNTQLHQLHITTASPQ